MKKMLVLFSIGAALVVSAAAYGNGSVGQAAPSLTLRFLEVQTQFGGSIPQNQQPRPGDRFWFHSEFYRWHLAKRGANIGHADTTAVVLPGGVVQVTGVAALPGGTVSVVGNAADKGAFRLAVVGGTGAYATARGEVVIRGIGGEGSPKSSDTLRIWR